MTATSTTAAVRASPRATVRELARHHPRAVLGACLAALGVLAVVAVGIGSVPIAPSETIAIVHHRLFGVDVGIGFTPASDAIVWDLRIPRVNTAAVVGVALAVAGATFQGLLRNPLADPYVLGTASGAGLGAAIALILPIRVVALQFGLLLGDTAAGHLGIDVRKERGILLAMAAMATAAAVAISGLIGFVGLVVPHFVRLVVGPGARRVIPLSMLVGATLLAAADLVARLVGDIPVGVVMALLGAPFFLVLLYRSRTGYEL